MIDCENISGTLVCIDNSSNILMVKFIILTLILIYFIYMWLNSDKIDENAGYYEQLLKNSNKYMAFVYILVAPFTYLLLYYKIDFEMFIYYISAVYLVGFVIGFGLVALWTKRKLLEFVSKEAKMRRSEKRKYKE
jgi:hypothetical protein